VKKAVLYVSIILIGASLLMLISGCMHTVNNNSLTHTQEPKPAPAKINTSFTVPMPESPGLFTARNDEAVIDYSNKHEGYITVHYKGDTTNELRVMITAPDDKEYIYKLNNGTTEVFPLTEGDGKYKIGLHEHVEGNAFRDLLITTVDVELDDEFAPFIRPSQYVNYCNDNTIKEKATELSIDLDNFFDLTEAIFNYVINNISYDEDLSINATFGHIPQLDIIIEQGSGICFDIASLTAGMLRSVGIPAKLVFGEYNNPYIEYTYHAWVKVYSETDGKIGDNIIITGGTWNILDPTVILLAGFNYMTEYMNDENLYTASFYY